MLLAAALGVKNEVGHLGAVLAPRYKLCDGIVVLHAALGVKNERGTCQNKVLARAPFFVKESSTWVGKKPN